MIDKELVESLNFAEKEAYLKGYEDGKKSPVREFHEKFGDLVKDVPAIPDTATRVLRVKLLLEEVLEFSRASGVRIIAYSGNEEIRVTDEVMITDEGIELEFEREFATLPDTVEAADALADIRYVTDGANLAWGFPQEEILQEVHRSNMSKLGEDGKPIYRKDGKIMKGSNYFKPDIAGILRQHGWKGREEK